MEVSALFAHAENDSAGRFQLEGTETEIRKQAREFVEAGYRNQTWITVDFGSYSYSARNSHGKAVTAINNY